MTISLQGKSMPIYASGYATDVPQADGTSEKMFVLGTLPMGLTLDRAGVIKLVDYLTDQFGLVLGDAVADGPPPTDPTPPPADPTPVPSIPVDPTPAAAPESIAEPTAPEPTPVT